MDISDRAERLFLAAADLSADAQAAFLKSACGGDRQLEAEVQALLASDRDSADVISSAIREEAALMCDAEDLQGQRLGAYRLVHEIGHGGMGSVYLALRDDHQYRKEVAIKVVKRGMDTAEVLERFRYERQILASLDHPSIARLLDAGTTSDGRPFFVMEYIEGQPIDLYCRNHALRLNEICNLFLRVCEAVAHAHRNLIVHRDLKPGNILVTSEGAPKLLDFGVAKLLEGGSADGATTNILARPFTPEYASPEQVRGSRVTTATDIYALGAILFELLTGTRAQPLSKKEDPHSYEEIQRAVCESETQPPSMLAPHVDSDLDTIVLMAMRKEPERRYASIDQLAEDIRRYLDGWPVAARQDSLAYRAKKFIRRHKIQVAAAALVAASLIGGIVVSVAQSRRAEAARKLAEAQRQVAIEAQARAETESREARTAREAESRARVAAAEQRDEAERQSKRAEERLNDLLELANRTLFDVNDSIQALPGALDARRKIVKTTLDYLQRFERESGFDSRMRIVLSAAYHKISKIQFDDNAGSLRDLAGAAASLRKAEEFLAPVYRSNPANSSYLRQWIEIRGGMAELMSNNNQTRESLEIYEQLVPLAHRLAELEPKDASVAAQEGAIQSRIARLQNKVEVQLAHLYRARDIFRDVSAKFPESALARNELGATLATIGGRLASSGDLDGASESYRESIEIRERMLKSDSHNAILMRNLLVVYGNYAAVLGLPWSANLGRDAEARAYCEKAVAIARELVAADPQNSTARLDLANAVSRLGMVEPESGKILDSLATLKEAAAALETALKANPKSIRIASSLSLTREYIARRYEALGDRETAVSEYRHSLAEAEPFADGDAASLAQVFTDEQALALLYSSAGDRAHALDYAERSLQHAQKYRASDPASQNRTANLANAYFILASVHNKFGTSDRAIRAAQQGLELWETVQSPTFRGRFRSAREKAQAILSAGGR